MYVYVLENCGGYGLEQNKMKNLLNQVIMRQNQKRIWAPPVHMGTGEGHVPTKPQLRGTGGKKR